MRRLRAGLVTSRSGRFGVSRPTLLEGLQVDLLDVGLDEGGPKACRIGVCAAHPVQARKNGSGVKSRRRKSARTAQACAGVVRREAAALICVSVAYQNALRLPAHHSLLLCYGRTRRRPNNTGDGACAIFPLSRWRFSFCDALHLQPLYSRESGIHNCRSGPLFADERQINSLQNIPANT